MSDARRWFTKARGLEKGPFEPDALRRSLRAGTVKRTTLVRAEDEQDWRPLHAVREILQAQLPPEPPRTAPPPPAEDTKLVVLGILACGLTYVGLPLAIVGIVLTRKKLRSAPTKNARLGYVLSLAGLAVQVLLLAGVAVLVWLSKKYD
jgi:hypothetical protein